METVLLSQSDVSKLITEEEVIDIVDKTYQGFGKGEVINPTKIGLDLGETAEWPPYKGFMNAMPAYVGWLDSAGLKWAGGFLDNEKIGLPYISGMILLIDPKNGQFKAVMDGAEITNLRTGTQAAVALKYLRSKKSIKIGLYGAGMQGHHVISSISHLFDIDELRVFDIRREASEIFAKNMKEKVSGDLIIVDSPEEAAKADAVISFTQSKEKFIEDEWLKPGTILFPMGSYQECTDDFIRNSDYIIVDHIGQCLHRGALKELNEKGEINEENIYATIGEIAIGKKMPVDLENKRTICILIGTGALDVAVATIVYQKAIKRGKQRTFDFIND
jgi:alanine dehydrogenase